MALSKKTLALQLTDAGRGMLVRALTGEGITFTRVAIGSGRAIIDALPGYYWYDTAHNLLYVCKEQWTPDGRRFTYGEDVPEFIAPGDLWYIPSQMHLFERGAMWKPFYNYSAVASAPANPSVNDLWVNTSTGKLMVCKEQWTPDGRNFTYGENVPTTISDGDLWYVPSQMHLFERGAMWEASSLTFEVSASAPANPSTNDYWLNASTHKLMVYNGTEWVEYSATNFTYGGPVSGTPSVGDYLYSTEDSRMYQYNKAWIINDTHFSTSQPDPTESEEGDLWYEASDPNAALMVYGKGWEEYTKRTFTYGDESTMPPAPVIGDFRYITSNDPNMHPMYCYEAAWIINDTHFSTSEPDEGESDRGDLWFEASNPDAVLMVFEYTWALSDAHFTRSDEEPENPEAGDLWYCPENQTLYKYMAFRRPGEFRWVPIANAHYTESDDPPFTASSLTALLREELSVDIRSWTRYDSAVSVNVIFDNNTVYSEFDWTETGLFAKGEDDVEVLYAYFNSGDGKDTIYENGRGIVHIVDLTVIAAVDNAESISAVLAETSTWVPMDMFLAHLNDYDNPHKNTQDTVHLENVENVAPSDAQITIENITELSEPESGEKLSAILGKLKLLIKLFIKHIKARNGHGTRPQDIGAAAADHSHIEHGSYKGHNKPAHEWSSYTFQKGIPEVIFITKRNPKGFQLTLGYIYPNAKTGSAILLMDWTSWDFNQAESDWHHFPTKNYPLEAKTTGKTVYWRSQAGGDTQLDGDASDTFDITGYYM